MFGIFGRKMRKVIGPVICARPDHCISRKNIDQDALRVLYRLSDLGYTAYLVGGGVRDLLLGRQPKDFDVGTSAKPNEVKRAFRNCFLIGRRFRLAHVRFGSKVIETATFRQESQTVGEIIEHAAEGPFEDNTFGTPETDAYRRDFTVNGLFYDIKTFAVIDWVGGLKDLKKKLIRSIGDPMIRFREDPVRMMRAVKFASRLDFTIEKGTERAIRKLHSCITTAAVPGPTPEPSCGKSGTPRPRSASSAGTAAPRSRKRSDPVTARPASSIASARADIPVPAIPTRWKVFSGVPLGMVGGGF